MAVRTILDKRAGIGPATLRRDLWWLQPAITLVVLGGFVIYSTWAAFQNGNYYANPYVSPFYSPCLASRCLSRTTPSILGKWWGISPAIAILPFPLLFRATCYYYRKAYYRAFFWSPPACAVREPHKRYSGESKGLLLVQNIHRYGFFLVIPFCVFLTWDAINSFFFPDGFGMGLGTLILLSNAMLLTLYTLSCHSARHIFGGHVDQFSRAPVRRWMWERLTWLNERHMIFAWASLIVVALADLYVRLVATGTIHDPRVF
jgi:hypothetical protein